MYLGIVRFYTVTYSVFINKRYIGVTCDHNKKTHTSYIIAQTQTHIWWKTR